jgi:hypothetical protein
MLYGALWPREVIKLVATEANDRLPEFISYSLLISFVRKSKILRDLAALEGLFAEDVVSYSDGGGLVRAARVPVAGRERVAKFIAAFASNFWKGVTLAWVEANGQESVLNIA